VTAASTEPLGFVFAIAGSASYAVAAVTQQRACAKLPSGRAFDPAVLARLARRPAWLAGLLAVVAGFGFQAAALALGRLVVIEPVLASGLLFALALAAYRDRRMPSAREWLAVLAVVAGLGTFLVAGQPSGGHRTASPLALGIAVGIALCVTGMCAFGAGRLMAGHHRALILGIGGGVAAGVTDASIKSVTVIAAGHWFGVFADPRLYLLAVVGLLTFTTQQNGYRHAGLKEFLPSFAVVEPVTGSLLGLLIYSEYLSDNPVRILLELAACVAAGWGIVSLASSGVPVPVPPQIVPVVVGPAEPAAAVPVNVPDPAGVPEPVGASEPGGLPDPALAAAEE
jgi:drug/metabolite transporter (DMT)-like permease